LRNGDTAFGVRAGWSEGYAGGGASFEALYLFHIDGKALRVVFAQPMMFNKMIAGDWHKDGTRSHDLTDGSNTLNVLPGTTAGYHDLQLRERNGKWRQTWRWSEASQAYQVAINCRQCLSAPFFSSGIPRGHIRRYTNAGTNQPHENDHNKRPLMKKSSPAF